MREDPRAEPIPRMKLVLLGETTVGKTSIMHTISTGAFLEQQTATVGASFYSHVVAAGGAETRLHIWDTAGQEQYRALAPMYYRDAQVAILVYAVDNQESFLKIEGWYNALADDCLQIPRLAIAGNKIDLVEKRVVTFSEGKDLATKLNARFFEVSAKKDPLGIERMIREIAEDAVKHCAFKPPDEQKAERLDPPCC
jgi:small GTP-binding protein